MCIRDSHYIEVDYDLSDVMFVCTSNSMNIPAPLLDRMEVIRIPGYTEDEKLSIAKNHLLPKQMQNNGVKSNEIDVADDTLLSLIRQYTREAGVRSLDRQISKVIRKVIKQLTQKELTSPVKVLSDSLAELCGVPKLSLIHI